MGSQVKGYVSQQSYKESWPDLSLPSPRKKDGLILEQEVAALDG